MADAIGWAVTVDGVIQLKSVSDTRTAAIVNYLFVNGIFRALRLSTDEDIQDAWFNRPDPEKVQVVQVNISVITKGISHE
jgi:hypothetical protein